MRTYSDDLLATAISTSHSWRGVLLRLGLTSTSAGSMRSVRRRADHLGLDYRHFRGQRRWSDADLVRAVDQHNSWTGIAEALGLAGGSSTATLRGHAVRMGLDTRHVQSPPEATSLTRLPEPDLANLSRAGTMLAAAWYVLGGGEVSWPLEPCRYDLVVWRGGRAERVQVKTTTVKVGQSWKVRLATSGARQVTYAPDEIDTFFVIDGDLRYYLIPLHVMGGLKAIHLARYERFAVSPGLAPTAPATPCSPRRTGSPGSS